MKLSVLNEGAWGYGPLDNDAASDRKWEIGRSAVEGLSDDLMNKSDPRKMYHAIGLWLDLEDRLETRHSYLTDDIKAKHFALAREAIEWLLNNTGELHYDEPSKVENILKRMQDYIESQELELVENIAPDHKDMLKSLFTDNPIMSMALEPKEDSIEELEDEIGDEISQKSYGQSSNYHRLNTYGNDDIRGSQK